MNPEDKKIIEMLENTAQGIKPNIVFEHELEKKLAAAHKPKRKLFALLRQNIFPTLGWAVAIGALVLVLNFATRSLLSGTPAAGDGFVCPVTEPNGSLPPGETVESTEYLGNGELWTVLWPDGKVIMEQHNREADGSFSMKWGWVRAVTGALTIEGHRLDTDASADAPPLRADIPDGYGDTGFQVSALIFPTTGCWEVTGRVGESSLTFVTEVLFEGITPTPVTVQEISTPIPSTPVSTDGGYEWRGTTLTLSQPLPESPAEASVYSLIPDQYGTLNDVYSNIQRFGGDGVIIKGELMNYDLIGVYSIISAGDAFQKILREHRPPGLLEQFRSRGGGGGGGGTGFYKLNLSGTPVSFPTPTPTLSSMPNSNRRDYTVQEGDNLTSIAEFHGVNIEEILQANGLSTSNIFIGQELIIPRQLNIGQRFEGLRGLVIVNIYQNSNGNQRVEYGFVLKQENSPRPFMFLEGIDLSILEQYHNRPADISGVIDRIDNFGHPTIKVDRIEIPYPDLGVQVLQGTQENIDLDGKTAVLFTTSDGEKYIQLSPSGELIEDADIDPTRPQLFIEGLIIPNETYAGYPAFRYFTGGFVFNPQDGTPMQYETSIDQPYIFEDVSTDNTVLATATIETVELVYYIRDPYAEAWNPISESYLQPVWRFYGHYSNGDEFEILIQALKDEFLYPELAPYTAPG